MEFDNDVVNMFGLSSSQTVLMFSAQKLVTEFDLHLSMKKKDYEIKKMWLDEWEKSIVDYVNNATSKNITALYEKTEVHEKLLNELSNG